MPEVQLTIRTPCSSSESDGLTLTCDLDWTVQRLKEEIRQKDEKRPKVEDQRLVYSGKLLQDESRLSEVLRLGDGVSVYILHLVVRQPYSPPTAKKAEKSPTSDNGETNARGGSDSSDTTDGGPSNSFRTDIGDWASFLNQQQPSSTSSLNSADQHALWYQQMYAQYINSYMQQLATFHDATGAAAAADTPNNFAENRMDQTFLAAAAAAAAANNIPMMNNYYQQPQPAFNDLQQQPAAAVNAAAPVNDNIQPDVGAAIGAAAAAGQPPVMNAGGPGGLGAGMEDDDEGEVERDVIDWLYIMSRVVLLFSIVYFYSSVTRFILVSAFGIAVYLWNAGFFRRLQLPPQEQQPEPAAAAAPAEDEQRGRESENGDNNEENNGGSSENEATDEVDAAVTAAEAEHGLVSTVSTFVTTFFTSLLPEQPQVV